jgi:hypothetical protein
MKRGCVITIIIIGISFFSLLIYFYWGITRIFESEVPTLIKKIDIGEQNKIEILYIAGNATSRNYTQIRKIDNKTNKKYLLESYEKRYNYLEKYKLNGDSLILVLRDTSSIHLERVDTFLLNIQDIKYELK